MLGPSPPRIREACGGLVDSPIKEYNGRRISNEECPSSRWTDESNSGCSLSIQSSHSTSNPVVSSQKKQSQYLNLLSRFSVPAIKLTTLIKSPNNTPAPSHHAEHHPNPDGPAKHPPQPSDSSTTPPHPSDSTSVLAASTYIHLPCPQGIN